MRDLETKLNEKKENEAKLEASIKREDEIAADIVKNLENISQLTNQHMASKGLLNAKVEEEEEEETNHHLPPKIEEEKEEETRTYEELGLKFQHLTDKMKVAVDEMKSNEEEKMLFIDEDDDVDDLKLDEAIIEASGLNPEARVHHVQMRIEKTTRDYRI